MTTIWGDEQAIKRIRKIPNAIYHTSDWGKEPMITLLGGTAVEAANITVKVAKEYEQK